MQERTFFMLQTLTIIAPLFLIVFMSAFLRYRFGVGATWEKALNEFALKIGLPVLIFSTLAKIRFSFREESLLLIGNSLFLVGLFGLAILMKKVFRIERKMFLSLFICFVFSNIAYLGIPVITQLFGAEAMVSTSLVVAVYLFWVFTVGVGYLEYASGKGGRHMVRDILKNLVRNPLILAVLGGLAAGSLRIPFPGIVLQAMDMINASVTPLVLVVLGLFMGASKGGKLSDWIPALWFSLFTLIVSPLLLYGSVIVLGASIDYFSISILEAAMPLALTPFAFADMYDLHKAFIARSIVASTLLSVLTLPVWIAFLF